MNNPEQPGTTHKQLTSNNLKNGASRKIIPSEKLENRDKTWHLLLRLYFFGFSFFSLDSSISFFCCSFFRIFKDTLIFFNCLLYFVYIDVAFWNVKFSKFENQENVFINFQEFLKEYTISITIPRLFQHKFTFVR